MNIFLLIMSFAGTDPEGGRSCQGPRKDQIGSLVEVLQKKCFLFLFYCYFGCYGGFGVVL